MTTLIIVLFVAYLLMGGHFQAQHGFWAHERPRGPDFDQAEHDRAGCGWLIALLAAGAILVALFAAVAEGA